MENKEGSKRYDYYRNLVETNEKRLKEIDYLLDTYYGDLCVCENEYVMKNSFLYRLNHNNIKAKEIRDKIESLKGEKKYISDNMDENKRLLAYYYHNKDMFDEESKYKNRAFE